MPSIEKSKEIVTVKFPKPSDKVIEITTKNSKIKFTLNMSDRLTGKNGVNQDLNSILSYLTVLTTASVSATAALVGKQVGYIQEYQGSFLTNPIYHLIAVAFISAGVVIFKSLRTIKRQINN